MWRQAVLPPGLERAVVAGRRLAATSANQAHEPAILVDEK
jgi:hypothetical protein